MDFFEFVFGNRFDFNGDGKTDWLERMQVNMMINKLMEEEEEEEKRRRRRMKAASFSEYADIEPESDFYDEEYEEDIFSYTDTDAAECESDECGYSEPDFTEYEEYGEDEYIGNDVDPPVNRTRAPVAEVRIPLRFSLSVETPGQEAYSVIKREDYPNERKYEAALYLYRIETGTAYITKDRDKADEAERCRFILESDEPAAAYLTAYNGFICAQAVKENFDLPMEIPDEDTRCITYFDDLLIELAEEDTVLAVEVWVWCVKTFGPYRKYAVDKWSMYNGVISDVDRYPPDFLDLAIIKLGEDDMFRRELLSENPSFPHNIPRFIARALELELTEEAQLIFRAAAANKEAKSTYLENIVKGTILKCSDWETVETMERFRDHILPAVSELDNKRIKRLMPGFTEEVDSYIRSIERSSEKYRYSRRFAWRKDCEDGSAYGLDPLRYEKEEEYNAELQRRKYGWRKQCSQAEKYGLDVNDYETRDEYLDALRKKHQEEREEKARSREQAKAKADPLAETDKTVYSFCAVRFKGNNNFYSYLTGGLDVKIGDKVIVPTGDSGRETAAEVVSVSQHMRLTAPYPVDKAKTIIRIDDEDQQ